MILIREQIFSGTPYTIYPTPQIYEKFDMWLSPEIGQIGGFFHDILFPPTLRIAKEIVIE